LNADAVFKKNRLREAGNSYYSRLILFYVTCPEKKLPVRFSLHNKFTRKFTVYCNELSLIVNNPDPLSSLKSSASKNKNPHAYTWGQIF
jgi:hypothetical protein